MPRHIAFLCVGLVVGIGAGYVFGRRGAAEPAAESSAQTPATAPAPTAAPPVQPKRSAGDAALIKALEQQVADLRRTRDGLERALEAAAKRRPPPAAEPAAPTAAPAAPAAAETDTPEAMSESFEELAAGGAAKYGGTEFQKLAERLKKAGPAGVKLMTDVLGSKAPAESRFLAAGLLETIGDASALPALGKSLSADADLLVRRAASHAMAVIGTDAAKEPLREAMRGDTDWGVRVNAAYGGAKLGDEVALKFLQDSYFSEDTPAEYALAILGGLADVAAPSTAPTFRKILEETQDPPYLLTAMGALAKMKDTEAVAMLQKMADSDLPDMVKNAARRTIDAIQAP